LRRRSRGRVLLITGAGKFVYTATPNSRTAHLTFRDQEFIAAAESYYYVRVTQTDKTMAWASPIWVTG
jgi:hypothetical protein